MLPILVKTSDFVKDFVHGCSYASNMTIGQRIQGARYTAGFDNASEFARQATPYAMKYGRDEVSRQYIYNLERDKVEKPDPVLLAAIAAAANVDLHWLVTGEGKPKREVDKDPDEMALLTLYRRMSPEERLGFISKIINQA